MLLLFIGTTNSHSWPSKSRLQEIQVASRFTLKIKMDWTEDLWERFTSGQFQGKIEKREAGQVFPPPFVFPSRGIQLT